MNRKIENPPVETMNRDYKKDGLLYCGVCHEPKEAFFPEHLRSSRLEKHPVPCACRRKEDEERENRMQREAHESEVRRLKEQCFDYRIMTSWTFESSILDEKKVRIGQKYVEQWEEILAGNHGLLLWGTVGTGKTYFAACIANALLDKEVPVRMTNLAAIMNCKYEDRAGLIQSLNGYDLLIIDDFGMERDTSFGMETVYQVIDGRYMTNKPLILTTNLSLEALQHPSDLEHKRIYDRILEMTSGIRFIGEDFRVDRRKAKKKMLDEIFGVSAKRC